MPGFYIPTLSFSRFISIMFKADCAFPKRFYKSPFRDALFRADPLTTFTSFIITADPD